MKAFGHSFVPYGEEEMRCVNGMCNMVIWPCDNEEEVGECLKSIEGVIAECKHDPNERLVLTPMGAELRRRK